MTPASPLCHDDPGRVVAPENPRWVLSAQVANVGEGEGGPQQDPDTRRIATRAALRVSSASSGASTGGGTMMSRTLVPRLSRARATSPGPSIFSLTW
jgi:hypothetical protein